MPTLTPKGPTPNVDVIRISQDVRVPEKELAEKEGVSGSVRGRGARSKRRPVSAEAKSNVVSPPPPSSPGFAGGSGGGLILDARKPVNDSGGSDGGGAAAAASSSAAAAATATESPPAAAGANSAPAPTSPAEEALEKMTPAAPSSEWPKKVSVSTDDYLTKKEHDEKAGSHLRTTHSLCFFRAQTWRGADLMVYVTRALHVSDVGWLVRACVRDKQL